MKIPDDEYWTSGTDLDCPDKYFWCSKESEFSAFQTTWKSGHPDASAGDCVHVQVANGTDGMSPFGSSNCSEKKQYFCEVRQRGTPGRALAVECMALWDVSEGI